MRPPSLLLRLWLALVVGFATAGASAQAPAPRLVDLAASDGTKMKATYFAAGKPGPGVLLFHQCNRDRKMWGDLALHLAESGLNVLTLDFRGYGDSGGTAAFRLPPEEGQRTVAEIWPRDVDVAYRYLRSQPGVITDVIGAGGASCGVNQAILLAGRHPEVKSLVLLSGSTNHAGRLFLRSSPGLPIFASAADDDGNTVQVLQWIVDGSRNPGNQFHRYQVGGHGIEMFAPHPELTGLIVNWFDTTLRKTPGQAPVTAANAPRDNHVLETIDESGGAARVADMIARARSSDPKATLFPETIVNLIGYEHLEEGDKKGAIEIFQLNVTSFPNSPNVYDSLSDAYLADGQTELAKQSAEKVLKLLDSDKADTEDRRKLIRESAEQKLRQPNLRTH
jgi:dienelactone hydrolase